MNTNLVPLETPIPLVGVPTPSPVGILPKSKNIPRARMSEYTWLIYGQPGIGKTSLANDFDNPLILACEPGTKHLECYSVAIKDWNDIRQVVSALQNDSHEFKTIVIDTVDLFHRYAVNDLCAARKIEHPSDEAYGKGSDMVKNKIYNSLGILTGLGLGVVLISHEKQRAVKTRTMEYTVTCPSLSDSAAALYVGYADIVGYCHFDKETQSNRYICFLGNDYLVAKARTSEEISLPPEVLIPNVGEDRLTANIRSHFKGEITNVD